VESYNGHRLKKLVMPPREGGKSWTIYPFISIQRQSVTNGQTDGQICRNSTALCMHSLLTRDRNDNN